jgi:hypothetical protein
MNRSDRTNVSSAPPSIIGRIAQAFQDRNWGLVSLELLLIIVGILAALWIDDWVEERKDRRSEMVYLGLLVRDLDQMSESLQGYIDTETALASASAAVLKMLATEGYEQKGAELRGYLSDMGTRRTLRLVSAAYTDLTSTGNLQLIRSRSLRDELLHFFAELSRTQLVIEKNNNVFIDDLYWSFLMDAGISWAPTNWKDEKMGRVLSDAEDIYSQFVDPAVTYPVDRVLIQAPDAEIWNQVRRMCFLRLRVSSSGLSQARALIVSAGQLKKTIEDELRTLSLSNP